MNILDLDRLGDRLYQLDQDDELYQCTAQLVLAAHGTMTRLTQGDTAAVVLALENLKAALKPFMKDL